MEKSIYSHEYSLFLKQLRQAREDKGLTQIELAESLGQTQSFVSKVERGERRLDIVELWEFCRALELSFPHFVDEIDRLLDAKSIKSAASSARPRK